MSERHKADGEATESMPTESSTESMPTESSTESMPTESTPTESMPTESSTPLADANTSRRDSSDTRASTTQPLLEVRGLRTWFPIKQGLLRRTVGYVRAVDGIDLTVQTGKTLALVGESGCGKTTVGRSILRLSEPNAGEVLFRGSDILKASPSELRPLRRNIQMVFQDPMTSLNPRMRVRDIISEGMESFQIGRNAAERTERTAEVLERVRLNPDHMWRFPHEFSGGQRQRIGVARALAVEPELIICDEAVSALDVSIQAQILNLLRDLQMELGLAYLFITHDLSVVRYLAHEVAVMYLGQIVEWNTTEDLFRRPKHPYTQGLLAAVPSVDPHQRKVRVQVLGDVPSPANPPSGCRFHTRCPYVFDRCPTAIPPLYDVEGGQARCYLHDPATAGGSTAGGPERAAAPGNEESA